MEEIVLLHGFAGTGHAWDPVREQLDAARYRSLAPDLRGHGRGLRTSEPFTLAACAQDAVRVAETLGCGPVLATGYSLGRYDARPWADTIDLPAAVVVTAHDRSVPPRKQRELADALGAPAFEVPADHMAVATHPGQFTAALLRALASTHQRVEREPQAA